LIKIYKSRDYEAGIFGFYKEGMTRQKALKIIYQTASLSATSI
jgi:hypothetical protein